MTSASITDEHLAHLAEHVYAAALFSGETIGTLHLHGNRGITDAGAARLCSALERVPLESLDLGYCSLTDGCVAALVRLLEANQTLSQVTVSGNDLTDDGHAAVEAALVAAKERQFLHGGLRVMQRASS